MPLKRIHSRGRQEGAGLVAAIALITIVAFVSLAVTRTVEFGAGSVSLDILSQRAALSASNGAQLGLNRVFAPAGTASCIGRSWDFSTLAGLPSCQANVTCSSTTVRGDVFYTVTSVATCSADTLQAERSVLVRATP